MLRLVLRLLNCGAKKDACSTFLSNMRRDFPILSCPLNGLSSENAHKSETSIFSMGRRPPIYSVAKQAPCRKFFQSKKNALSVTLKAFQTIDKLSREAGVCFLVAKPKGKWSKGVEYISKE